MDPKRERVMAVLNGEKPDRVPLFGCIAHDGLLEHFGGKPIAVGDYAAVVHACSQFLDLCHPALAPQEPGVFTQDDGGQLTVERWTSWSSPRPFGPNEIPAALLAEIEKHEAWKPAEAAAQAPRPARSAEAAPCADGMLYISHGACVPICPFDLEQGFYALADHPELVRRWNRAVNERVLREMDARADPRTDPVCILWNDIAAKGGLIYPPALLDELFYPHLREQIDLLHSRGVKALFHCDGDATTALPELIDCGIDAFNPLEITAGMRPEVFLEVCGSQVALVGGVDAVDILARGTPQQVAAETQRLIDLFADAGNLIIASASGQVDDSMPLENVLAMYETVWEQGTY